MYVCVCVCIYILSQILFCYRLFVVVIQSVNRICLFATPWSAACQGPLSSIISWSLLKFMFIESVMLPTISSSVIPFFSCPQSFPASGSFPKSCLFTSGGQSIEASTSVFPMNIQDWFPLLLTGLIFLLFKGLLRIFSSITIQKHQFFSTQLSLCFNSHIHAWLLEKP